MRLLFLLLISISAVASADLLVGFNNSTCPRAESIVTNVVQERFRSDRTITAALLRLYFHDCFVTGCDASLLLNSTKDKETEKDAGPNFSVRGYEIIDQAKERLEKECPSTVSCADVVALATRDAVALAGGLQYPVPTGRRDALESNIDDASGTLGPSIPVRDSIKRFKARGLSTEDMVVLLGAHTVGVASCGFVEGRLPDPNMDAALGSKLEKLCNSTTGNLPNVALDQATPLVVDNKFYRQLSRHRGILQIDQALTMDNSTASIVAALRKDNAKFLRKFGDALVKLGGFQVLLGSDGEIRKKCGAANNP